jgi:hypothetical protein
MFTGSEEIEDMLKGYLKSGKALENKLQVITSLKHAIKSLEYMPGRASINEEPVEYENEDDDEDDNAKQGSNNVDDSMGLVSKK